jgi:hypothetical protein
MTRLWGIPKSNVFSTLRQLFIQTKAQMLGIPRSVSAECKVYVDLPPHSDQLWRDFTYRTQDLVPVKTTNPPRVIDGIIYFPM